MHPSLLYIKERLNSFAKGNSFEFSFVLMAYIYFKNNSYVEDQVKNNLPQKYIKNERLFLELSRLITLLKLC